MKKFLLVIFLIVVDQILKFMALKNFLPDIGGIFCTVCNPILSWGIHLEGFLFWFIWIIAFGVLVFTIKKFSLNFFLLLVFSGAVSNFIDRIARDCVVDYISIFSFPIFNFADVLITVGVFLFAANLLSKNHMSDRNQR